MLSWRLSNTLVTNFCMEAVQDAITHYGRQKSSTPTKAVVTSQEFTGLLKQHHIAITMGGTGSWRDNVFVEWFWRSVKYEEVYLHAYDGVSEAKKGLERYVTVYTRGGRARR